MERVTLLSNGSVRFVFNGDGVVVEVVDERRGRLLRGLLSPVDYVDLAHELLQRVSVEDSLPVLWGLASRTAEWARRRAVEVARNVEKLYRVAKLVEKRLGAGSIRVSERLETIMRPFASDCVWRWEDGAYTVECERLEAVYRRILEEAERRDAEAKQLQMLGEALETAAKLLEEIAPVQARRGERDER